MYKAAERTVNFCREHNIVIASFGGLTPIVRVTDGPISTVLPVIRERLEKMRGKPVTEGQVLLKWLQVKNILIVT